MIISPSPERTPWNLCTSVARFSANEEPPPPPMDKNLKQYIEAYKGIQGVFNQPALTKEQADQMMRETQ